jgi:hypothetical protein
MAGRRPVVEPRDRLIGHGLGTLQRPIEIERARRVAKRVFAAVPAFDHGQAF